MRHWLLLVAVPALLHGQAPDQKPLAFDVASIKASNAAESSGGSVFQPNGRYMAHNMPVRDVIAEAYRVRTFQVVGGPNWINIDRFEIDAKADNGADSQLVLQANGAFAAPDAPFVRLRTLLKDRFHLAAHNETRDGQIYALGFARSDNALGPKLRARTEPCSRPQNAPAEFCGGIRRASGLFTARGATMAQLASGLSAVLGRPVLDRTGVGRLFDFDLEWTPTSAVTANPNSDAKVDPETSLFTALQEQLGLKLQSTRGPVDVLVIDHVEKPTPD